MKHRFVDIHHHLAYGVDDGPKNFKQMQKMLRQAARENIGVIFATPHVTPGVRRFRLDEYHQALEDARDYCSETGLDIQILEGCEILYTDQTPRLLRDGYIPTMNETDFVLVEFSPDIKYKKLKEALDAILCQGYRPIVAHVERYMCLVHRPSRAEKIKDTMDVRFQMNCSSVIKRKGLFVNLFVNRMLKKQLIDALGTDSHNVTSRAANMKTAWKIVRKKYGSRYAERLTNGSLLEE